MTKELTFYADFYPPLLLEELIYATGWAYTTDEGNPRVSFFEGGVIVYADDDTADEVIQGVIDSHNPTGKTEEENLFDVYNLSEDDIRSVPEWSTWDKKTANDWYTTNVTDLIDAIPDIDNLTALQFQNNNQDIMSQYQDIINNQSKVIKSLGLMIVAIRNKLWPNLQE